MWLRLFNSAWEFSETVSPLLHFLPVVGMVDYCPFGDCSVCSSLLISFQEICQTSLFFSSAISLCICKIIISATLSDLANNLPEPSS